MRLPLRDERHERLEHEERDEPVVSKPAPPAQAPPPLPAAASPEPGLSRPVLWAILFAALLLLIAIASRYFDEYLRRTIEAKMNQRLQGYTVTLQGAHLNPFGLALTLRGAVIRQQAHPDPAVADFPRVIASVQWAEILHRRLVANAVLDRPRIHVNLPQLQQENRDKVDLSDRGWQDAFQSIYPLKFNEVRVRGGELVYVDKDPKKPLEISHLDVLAANIRNTRSDNLIYPSPVRAEGDLFGTGHGLIQGHADFLSKPYPGVHALYRLEHVPLERLSTLSYRANLEIRGGKLDSNGEVEYGPRHREAHVVDVTVGGVHLDYIHTAATAPVEKRRAAEASRLVKEDQTPIQVRIDRFRLNDSNLGLVNRAADHPFRVYVSHTDLLLTRLSSGFKDGPAKARLTGRFMGSGATRASATFREQRNGADFDLDVAIENASLPALNDLLRSYGKLDVAKGTFSIYSEIHVKDGRIAGYVKPLIKDVKVYDPKQDKKKPVLKKLYEKVVGGLSKILRNRPRKEVATVVDISGSIDDPNTSLWTIFVRLVSNAFVKAILPGFEHQIDLARHLG
jgi:hypothetical protein